MILNRAATSPYGGGSSAMRGRMSLVSRKSASCIRQLVYKSCIKSGTRNVVCKMTTERLPLRRLAKAGRIFSNNYKGDSRSRFDQRAR
jgi:hypothetical protein